MKISLGQIQVYPDKSKNLDTAKRFGETASSDGADVLILPEMFVCPYENECFPVYAEERYGETYSVLSKIAKDNNLLLIAGSVPERDNGKLYNTSYVFDPEGREIAYHRKAHLFDINIAGKQSFRESDTFTPGDKATVFEYAGHTFGLAICFDIRFPDLFMTMAKKGAEAVFVPAAFNMTTGPMHWELGFRMRAVDNQLFTVGCAPARARNGKYVSFANSIVCSPWGQVLYNAGENECCGICEIDLSDVSNVRSQLPILSARREELYE